jgi:hypothetical protein
MTLSTLPNELIYEIASHATKQPAHSPTTRPSALASDLATLTCLSKRVRDIALPILFRDVAVSCPERLFKLSIASPQLLSLIR